MAQGRDTKRVKFSGEVWRCKNPPLAPVVSGPLSIRIMSPLLRSSPFRKSSAAPRFNLLVRNANKNADTGAGEARSDGSADNVG